MSGCTVFRKHTRSQLETDQLLGLKMPPKVVSGLQFCKHAVHHMQNCTTVHMVQDCNCVIQNTVQYVSSSAVRATHYGVFSMTMDGGGRKKLKLKSLCWSVVSYFHVPSIFETCSLLLVDNKCYPGVLTPHEFLLECICM